MRTIITGIAIKTISISVYLRFAGFVGFIIIPLFLNCAICSTVYFLPEKEKLWELK